MPYREPAEDEDAALDAAELATFMGRLRRARTRDAWRFVVLGVAVVVVGGAFAVYGTRKNALEEARAEPRCDHRAYEISVNAGIARGKPVCVPASSAAQRTGSGTGPSAVHR